MTDLSPKRLKFLGCEIIYREACRLASESARQVDVEFLAKGLHDLPTADMVARVQQRIDEIDAEGGYEAILLGYARCNDGLVGVTARSIPLVIPKAHDCITFFFGSRGAYKTYFDENPGTYFHTTGWAERNNSAEGQIDRPAYGQQGVMAVLGLTESYEQLVAKHGKDNADYIVETLGGWEKAYRRLCYIEMGICDESALIADARRKAEQKNWTFECRKGSMDLLRRLFEGPWDEDFVVVRPGQAICPRNDDEVLSSQ